MAEQWTQIRALFREAIDLEPAQWDAFLRTKCPDNQEVRDRVLVMLNDYGTEDDFLKSPVEKARRQVFGQTGTNSLVGQRIGAYEIKREIAKGGMGVVFEALDVKLQKKVALKMMNPGLIQDPLFRSRFEQEAQMLAKLEDPHFVRVYALIEEAGNAFIVMEYVEGKTLAQHIRTNGKLPAREVAGMGVQLLQALSKAHRQGVIHRDLKPSNIMLTRSPEGKPIVKVLDFGIAKSLQSDVSQTRTQGAVGTLLYMSPEQARGLKSIDHRTDLYSLGVTLYEAVSGNLPFDLSEDEFAIRKGIVEGQIIPLSKNAPEVPAPIADVVMRAIEADPSRRFQTSEEMQLSLRKAFHDTSSKPLPELPASTPKKAMVYRVAGALFSLMILVGAGWYFSSRPSEEPVTPSTSTGLTTPAIDTTTAIAPPDSTTLLTTLTESENLPDPEEVSADSESPPAQATDPVREEPATPDPAVENQTTNNDVGNTAQQSTPSEAETLPDNASDSEDSLNTDPPLEIVEPPPAMGSVELNIIPFGDVYLNGELAGSGLPNYRNELSPDAHVFRIQYDAAQWICTVFVASEKTSEVKVDFSRSAFVTVTAIDEATGETISNASILLDGYEIATTPQKIPITPGVHRIQVAKEGYDFVEIMPQSPSGCFQHVGSSRINFDPNYNEGESRVQARLRASR